MGDKGFSKTFDFPIPFQLDLPRFRGGLRAWDQDIWSDGILPSHLVAFFCSAPGGAILPSRPAQWCGRRPAFAVTNKSAERSVVEQGVQRPSPSLSTARQTYNCLLLRGRSREPSPGSELAPSERVLSE